jgi:ribonuclease HI
MPPPSVSGGPDPDSNPTSAEPRGPVFTEPHWTLYFDGSARQQFGWAGVVLIDPSGDQVKYMVHLEFKATNNMAEYEALIFGLSAALSLGIRQLLVKGDSQLIIKQVHGECSCNEPRLAAYLRAPRGGGWIGDPVKTSNLSHKNLLSVSTIIAKW